MKARRSFWVRGRLSPNVVLVDGREESLAPQRVRGVEAVALGRGPAGRHGAPSGSGLRRRGRAD